MIDPTDEVLRPRWSTPVDVDALSKFQAVVIGTGERAVLRAVRAPEGDFRPWGEIAPWAESIAELLERRLVASG